MFYYILTTLSTHHSINKQPFLRHLTLQQLYYKGLSNKFPFFQLLQGCLMSACGDGAVTKFYKKVSEGKLIL